MNLMAFAQLMERRSVQVEHNALQLKKKVTSEVLRAVATATPADTGRAISNWKVVFLDSIRSSNLPFVPGIKGSTKPQNISATISAGSSPISAIKLGQVVTIVNSVDYIQDLNDGDSKQEPAGFVERAVQVGRRIVASARIIAS